MNGYPCQIEIPIKIDAMCAKKAEMIQNEQTEKKQRKFK